MNREKMIKTLSVLGGEMIKWGKGMPKEEFNPFLAEDFYNRMEEVIKNAKAFNGWFVEENVRESLLRFGEEMTEEKISRWMENYAAVRTSKKVGLILAGNIPLVGFHDVLTTLLSGNIALIKLSSDDLYLIPLLLEIIIALQPEIKEKIEVIEKLNDAEAVIATGSNNTARYFEKYFGKLPHIIRKNRTSLAILNGEETKEELEALGKDVFTYFGLGCRNVTHLMLPKSYDLDNIFGAFIGFGEIIHHHKYANNYDYYRSVFLLNEERFLENGFLITKETEELFSPVSILNYHFYQSEEEVENYLNQHNDNIQDIVGKNYKPFGTAQCPAIDDYADGVDTMKFLTKL